MTMKPAKAMDDQRTEDDGSDAYDFKSCHLVTPAQSNSHGERNCSRARIKMRVYQGHPPAIRSPSAAIDFLQLRYTTNG